MSRAVLIAVLALSAAPALSHAQGEDRYGPAPTAYAPNGYGANGYGANGYGAAPPAPVAFRGRMLSWPGKQAPPARIAAAAPDEAPPSFGEPSRAYAPRGVQAVALREGPRAYGPPQTYPAPAWRRTRDTAMAEPSQAAPAVQAPARAYGPQRWTPPSRAYAAQAAPATYAAPEADGWRPVGRPGSSAPLAGAPSDATRPAPPTSIYAQAAEARTLAARAAPPTRVGLAQRSGEDPTQDRTVRFYSVHRPFGLKPDPAPIPPQFFTNTADLAEPPGPLPLERTTAAETGSTRVVRAAPDTSAN